MLTLKALSLNADRTWEASACYSNYVHVMMINFAPLHSIKRSSLIAELEDSGRKAVSHTSTDKKLREGRQKT